MAKCDGYSFPVGNTKPSSSSVPTYGGSDLIVISGPTFDLPGNDQERRCFDFFRKRTASQLSGFFDSDFWNRLVLQATHCEPPIRHAVLALGSLHEQFENGERSILSPIWERNAGAFALQHYIQAIKYLINPIHEGQQAVDVCLIACMLFASFEVSLDHFIDHICPQQYLQNSLELRRDLRVCRHFEDIRALLSRMSTVASKFYLRSTQLPKGNRLIAC